MKKRGFAALLALVLTLTLLPTWAFASADSFSDVENADVARNVEVLQLMGVVSGDGNGLFRPYSRLTRAEFCKMAVEFSGEGSNAFAYRSRTIFPDVRTSHWAVGYINYATTPPAEKKPALMHGFPDGTFLPNKEISFAEAVTVLMRVLGYSDADVGGAWPQGYLDLASAKKLTKGLSLSSDTAITRAQAAQMFVNALSVEKAGKSGTGETIYTLGKKETTLLSVDLAKGTMRTADGENTTMANPMEVTALRGLRGYVVSNANGKVLTFLPTSDLSGSSGTVAASDAAVIVASDGSTAGFDALTGGKTNYAIYRNGSRVNSRSLKKYDVATYSAGNNAILVCDTRVQVYYESCTPSPSEPTTIEALGGTKFSVLSTARQSLSEFKPGAEMVLLLTADGQIASAVKPGTPGTVANAIAYVNKQGKAMLFCGAGFVDLNSTSTSYAGQVVTVGQTKAGNVIYTSATNQVAGALDLTTNTVGTFKLASNVLVLQDGVLTSLSSLGVSRLEADRILYARRNNEGEVDLVVLGAAKSNMLYGRATVESSTESTWVWRDGYGTKEEKNPGINGEYSTAGGYHSSTIWIWYDGHGDSAPKTEESGYYSEGSYKIIVDRGPTLGKTAKITYPPNYHATTGDFVVVELRSINAEDAVSVKQMQKSTAVARASWVGKEIATADGVTYSIPKDIPCWNADSKTWFKDLDEALEYGGIMYFYIADDAVRVIEFRG